MATDIPIELRDRYTAAGQAHVFEHADAGRVSDVAALVEQLSGIDVEAVATAYQSATADAAAAAGAEAAAIEPITGTVTLSEASAEQRAAWRAAGLAAIQRGEVALVTLAGGQGTRLGFDGPKGSYNIGMPSGKTLFQMYAERVARVQALAGEGATVPWLIMTSTINHAATVAFFEQNAHFGLDPANVTMFMQGTLPCMTEGGQFIMQSAGVVATAPDGNAGIYKALGASGCLAQMRERGVRLLHVTSVDSAITKVAQPELVGFTLEGGFDVCNATVTKTDPNESVGVFGRRGGAPHIIEYSELTDEQREARDAAGGLLFGQANICNHVFSVDFVDAVLEAPLPWHIARKKIPHADAEGNTVKPDDKNGIKLEGFIFDAFARAQAFGMLAVDRATSFSPVKNAPGNPVDSPDSARDMLSAEARAWIAAAGGTVAGDGLVEVSPLLSYAGEGLEERVGGQTVEAPVYLQ